MSNFAQRLRDAMQTAGMKAIDLHERTGIGKATISEYLSGSYEPKQKNVYKLAEALHVAPSYLMGLSEQGAATAPPAPQKSIEASPAPKVTHYTYRIPVLGRVVAGIPIEAIEEIIDWEEIPQKLAASGKFFALRVYGHSMEPRILEGDVVIVRQQEDVDSGDIAIVLVNGDEATVKRVKKQEDGITLIATNTSVYEPHFYSNQEIRDLPVRILGKVVELRGKV